MFDYRANNCDKIIKLMNDSDNTDSILIDESIPEQTIPEIPEQTIPEIPTETIDD